MATDHYTAECEVLLEADGPRSITRDRLKKLYNDCKKNPGHQNFIPVTEFGPEHLPEELRTEKYMRSIKRKCDLTVRAVVKYTSTSRPDTFKDGSPYPWSDCRGRKGPVRFGTGIIMPRSKSVRESRGKCPCPLCQNCTSPKMTYWSLMVKTATHVICDDLEAQNSEFECFFNTDNRSGVKILYGLRIDELHFVPDSRYPTDTCYCVCVTHDEHTIDILQNLFKYTTDYPFNRPWFRFPRKDVIISHPHGCCKKLTVGTILYATTPVKPQCNTNTPTQFWSDTICRLPLKPWTSDETSSQTWNDEQGYIHFIKHVIDVTSEAQQHNPCKDDNHFTRYMRKRSRQPKNVKEKLSNVLAGGLYDVYRYAFDKDLVYCTLDLAKRSLSSINFIICRRLTNMQHSPAHSTELIDIGLLLLRCYLRLVVDLLKDAFAVKNTAQRSPIFGWFIENMFLWQPEIRLLFDYQQYVVDKFREYQIDDVEYSKSRDIWTMVMRILTAEDVTVDDKSIGSGPRCKDNKSHDNDDVSDDDKFSSQIFTEFIHNSFTHYLDKFHFEEKNRNLVEGGFLQPGSEFKLPSNVGFTLPSDATFAFRYYQGNPGSIIFPAGTKFQLIDPDTGIGFDFRFPPETEFISFTMLGCINRYLNYDIATCPGSSGASLGCTETFISSYLHNGFYDHTNRSGTTYYHRCTPKWDLDNSRLKT